MEEIRLVKRTKCPRNAIQQDLAICRSQEAAPPLPERRKLRIESGDRNSLELAIGDSHIPTEDRTQARAPRRKATHEVREEENKFVDNLPMLKPGPRIINKVDGRPHQTQRLGSGGVRGTVIRANKGFDRRRLIDNEPVNRPNKVGQLPHVMATV
jgi:hypothetical protein